MGEMIISIEKNNKKAKPLGFAFSKKKQTWGKLPIKKFKTLLLYFFLQFFDKIRVHFIAAFLGLFHSVFCLCKFSFFKIRKG